MMENKDLLNRLLPYTGYNLKVAFENNIMDIDPSSLDRMCSPKDTGRYFKPILFSSDDLTKEIETEYGKEVPLIELAKINYERFEISPMGMPEFKIALLRDNAVVGGWNDAEGKVELSYDPEDWTFKVWSGRYPEHLEYNTWVDFYAEEINILKIMDYIYSRHIAIGLDSHEYVNACSLKTNPYVNGKQINTIL